MKPSRFAPTKTLDKGLGVLWFLAGQRNAVRAKEIARHLNLNATTVYRLLRTLELHGLVQQDGGPGRYSLGIRTIELGNAFLESFELRALARPTLVRLMEETRETIHLMVLAGDMGVYLDRVESPHRVRAAGSVGLREHLHRSAVGKAILAYLPGHVVEKIVNTAGLPRFTPNTITDPAKLTVHLQEIRRAGHAIDRSESEEGVRCVGAPVFDLTGRVAASISVSGPAYRLPLRSLRRLGKTVKAAAKEISTALGYAAPGDAAGRRGWTRPKGFGRKSNASEEEALATPDVSSKVRLVG